MERSSKERNSPKKHIDAIFQDYEASARVLETLTNLSYTVIETALNGQYKFLFEILQNADDAFDDESKYSNIKLQLVLVDNYFIIQHNGKAFDYYDVERICDYASQIGEIKANDLSKTGYKGLGFKSLFNLSDCIYIHSNGYSFRFDKCYWPHPEKKPWQVIPIWCDKLPLTEKYTYDQPVNFILKIKDNEQLNAQLKELSDHPEDLLYLHRVNSVYLNLNGIEHVLERKIEKIDLFHKTVFLKNEHAISTWFSRTYEQAISSQLRKCIQGVSQYIYPDKIKNAEEIELTFTLCTDETIENVLKIVGFCYSTLPTQLQLSLPYHINSLFILNLDRTQFHENEWNEFLVYQIGYLQLHFLKDLAEVPKLKNFVVELLVRKIHHPYNLFNEAFTKGFEEAKKQIAWLPTYKGCLMKFGEACIDKIHFFKQNFQNIRDNLSECIIDYDVKSQHLLSANEAKRFDYDSLFDQFSEKYYQQLTESSYIRFLNYIYETSQKFPLGSNTCELKELAFLRTRKKTLISPRNALLEEEKNPIPAFAEFNPVDNKYLPVNDMDSFKKWLVNLGAQRLDWPIKIIRESVFRWIKSYTLHSKMNINNHKAIIAFLVKNFQYFTYKETQMLKENLIILTQSNTFRIATSCCLPNAIILEELGEIVSDNELVSSCYDMHSLKEFFVHLGISEYLSSIEVFRKFILVWIKNGVMKSKLTIKNYEPIIEFLSTEYEKAKYYLDKDEKQLLREMPVLTSVQEFQVAGCCYFDTAVPHVEGFEDIIENYRLVSTENLNDNVHKFLSDIGVSEKMDPADIIRNSVLYWIQNETVQSRINLKNHHVIVKYVAELWNYYSMYNSEIQTLRKLPILTKGNTFRNVSSCYWQTTDESESNEKIPKLESIVSADELVSSEYYADMKEKPSKIETLLNHLGVRDLKFDNIYHRYCDQLTDLESIDWFFSNLVKHWKLYYPYLKRSELLNDFEVKLHTFCVLAKNGKMYPITELYSSQFLNIYTVDESTLPILAFDSLSAELEHWLGIKRQLELSCIMKLLEAVDKKQNLGEEVTLTFFKTVSKQLSLKDKNEINKYSLKLLSKENKLTTAKELYYFTEEDAICLADSCYLKRIHGMSHKETLKLAELCGVNLLPCNEEFNYGEEAPTYDKSLREFYLERLPFIVLQESKELNESPSVVLKNLILKVHSIELYKCHNIMIKYPFHQPVETYCNFNNLKIYVVGKWQILRTEIHEHIKGKLELITNIAKILDLESVAEDKKHWLHFQKESPEKLLIIQEELDKILSDPDYITVDKKDSLDNTSSNINEQK